MALGKDIAWKRLVLVWLAFTAIFISTNVSAALISKLYSRGFAVLPQPQQVILGNSDFPFGDGWHLVRGPNLAVDTVAEKSLKEGLHSRFGIMLSSEKDPEGRVGTINLSIVPNSISVGAARDRAKDALARQAYTLDLAPNNISITANAPQGLFYGVQTLLQLPNNTGLSLNCVFGQRLLPWRHEAANLERA